MSFHVYISLPGFKDEPISAESWSQAITAAIAGDSRLEAFQGSETGLRFRDNTRQWLSRTVHGLGHAQDPDRPLVEVMFEVANRLGAGVYSERLKPYSSPEDWESRTADYRTRRDDRERDAKKRRSMRRLFWAAVVLLGGAIGYLIG